MKTTRLFFSFLVFFAIVGAILLIAISVGRSLKPHHLVKNEFTTDSTPQPVAQFVSSSVVVDMEITNSDQMHEFFKTIVNQQSGQYAIVNSNRTAVILKDKNGKPVWSTDLAKYVEIHKLPVFWGTEIYSMQLYSNNLVVRTGRATYEIDKKTGEVLGFDSD